MKTNKKSKPFCSDKRVEFSKLISVISPAWNESDLTSTVPEGSIDLGAELTVQPSCYRYMQQGHTWRERPILSSDSYIYVGTP